MAEIEQARGILFARIFGLRRLNKEAVAHNVMMLIVNLNGKPGGLAEDKAGEGIDFEISERAGGRQQCHSSW